MKGILKAIGYSFLGIVTAGLLFISGTAIAGHCNGEKSFVNEIKSWSQQEKVVDDETQTEETEEDTATEGTEEGTEDAGTEA